MDINMMEKVDMSKNKVEIQNCKNCTMELSGCDLEEERKPKFGAIVACGKWVCSPRNKIISIIEQVTEIQPGLIQESDTFEFLNMDSLSITEAKVMIEIEFDIEIGDDVQLLTVKNLIDVVEVSR
jgi:acyl carrier protein